MAERNSEREILAKEEEKVMAFKYVKRTSKRAKSTKGVSYVAKGKKPKLGSGKRFSALAKAIGKRKGVSNPAAVAAAIGRKKYGKKRFQAMAVKGKKKK